MTENVESNLINKNIERSDTIENNLRRQLHEICANRELFPFPNIKVFSGGTAPMREGNSEIPFILDSTDFDEGTFVDPGYANSHRLNLDLQEIQRISDEVIKLSNTKLKPGEKLELNFRHKGKIKKITFIAGDATKEENIPPSFNIYFSGRRVCINDENLENTPSEKIDMLMNRLRPGGFMIPDRDLEDDAAFFAGRQPQDLSLREVEGIRPAPRTVLRLNDQLFNTKKNRYFNEAIDNGQINPKPLLKVLEFADGEKLEFLFDEQEIKKRIKEKNMLYEVKNFSYQSIDHFFSMHPNLKRSDFDISEFGLLHKELNLEIPFDEGTTEEGKIIDDIDRRSRHEATGEITIRGIGLYQKISQ